MRLRSTSVGWWKTTTVAYGVMSDPVIPLNAKGHTKGQCVGGYHQAKSVWAIHVCWKHCNWRYVSRLLEQFLEPQLQQDGILGTVVYQQDGAPSHFALLVREYLNRTFPNRWIVRGSPRLWTARSPDLTPTDCFLWGFVKDKVYRTKVRNLAVLKQRIREACAMITVAMLQKVFRAVIRWEPCFEMDGGQVEGE